MKCPACETTYPSEGRKVVCLCDGNVNIAIPTDAGQYLGYDPVWSCQLRGEIIGLLDCGCQGSPKVWACPLHGACALRKLKPGIAGYIDQSGNKVSAEIKFCNRCEDRKPISQE